MTIKGGTEGDDAIGSAASLKKAMQEEMAGGESLREGARTAGDIAIVGASDPEVQESVAGMVAEFVVAYKMLRKKGVDTAAAVGFLTGAIGSTVAVCVEDEIKEG